MPPNRIAAPNRRLRLGAVPWSLGTLLSLGSAVGELTLDEKSHPPPPDTGRILDWHDAEHPKRLGNAEPGAGPALPLGDSTVTKGPLSVS